MVSTNNKYLFLIILLSDFYCKKKVNFSAALVIQRVITKRVSGSINIAYGRHTNALVVTCLLQCVICNVDGSTDAFCNTHYELFICLNIMFIFSCIRILVRGRESYFLFKIKIR